MKDKILKFPSGSSIVFSSTSDLYEGDGYVLYVWPESNDEDDDELNELLINHLQHMKES